MTERTVLCDHDWLVLNPCPECGLDAVAGLNASKSHRPTPSEQAAYEQGLEDGRLVEQAARRMAGDASESPPSRATVTDDRGWASDPRMSGFGADSESGQPSELSPGGQR